VTALVISGKLAKALDKALGAQANTEGDRDRAPDLPLALARRPRQIPRVIIGDSEGIHVVERRLRSDRRRGLQRRIGDRRQDAADVPVDRRGSATRRGPSERRSGAERRTPTARIPS
jgi:hypothetical protein